MSKKILGVQGGGYAYSISVSNWQNGDIIFSETISIYHDNLHSPSRRTETTNKTKVMGKQTIFTLYSWLQIL